MKSLTSTETYGAHWHNPTDEEGKRASEFVYLHGIGHGEEVPGAGAFRPLPLIIGIHGKPHSGKDTICNIILKKINLERFGPSVFVKRATAAKFDVPLWYFYDEKKKEEVDPYWGITYREMAQKEGKEASRDLYGDDFWMRHVELYVKYKLPAQYGGIILPDIRYANEVEWIKKNDGIVLFVSRNDRPVASNEGHPAEHGLPESLADHIIRNDGSLEELEKKVEKLLEIL